MRERRAIDPSIDQRSADWRKLQGPWYQANVWLRCTYGINLEQYFAMEQEQQGRCAICGKAPAPNKGRVRKLHVDHCHQTGKVRGLLCHSCNVSLHALERPEWMEKAQAYLRVDRKPVEIIS